VWSTVPGYWTKVVPDLTPLISRARVALTRVTDRIYAGLIAIIIRILEVTCALSPGAQYKLLVTLTITSPAALRFTLPNQYIVFIYSIARCPFWALIRTPTDVTLGVGTTIIDIKSEQFAVGYRTFTSSVQAF